MNYFDKTIVIFIFSIVCCVTFAISTISNAQTKDETQYAALDPSGEKPEVQLIPLAPRGSDLNGKVVYIINSMPHGSGMDKFLDEVGKALKKRFPKATVVSMNRGDGYMRDDPNQRKEIAGKANAYVYGGSPTGSLTASAFAYASQLEKAGVPGTVIIYDTLAKVAISTRESIGSLIRYTAIPFPPESMKGKQKSAALDSIISALTVSLTADEKKSGMYKPPAPPRVAITGTLDEIQDFFYNKGLSDGLPIIPPTEEKVAAMLKGTKHNPQEVVAASMAPEKLKVTVEKVAINAVMAGARPEYMPVLLALVEAYNKDARGADSWVRSTNSFSFMQVVNGPIRKELKMNCDTYALGPGNQVNSVLGRALQLFIINLGGGEVGVNMMGVQGNPSCYSFVFGENEEKSPWKAFSVDKGFKSKESTLSLFSGGWSHSGNYYQPEDGLDFLAKDIAAFEYPSAAVALISPQRAAMLNKEGMSKEEVKEYIWENATSTLQEFRSSGYFGGLIKSAISRGGSWPKEYLTDPDDTIVPVYPSGKIEVIVVGGDAAPMMQGWKMSYVTTVSIDKWR
ncbi:MAG: hypothetical protein JXA50_09585 [Deltaproteobacteria bacterium]|nr:hypothetical protein [Deltaproteobacteria bacterium]